NFELQSNGNSASGDTLALATSSTLFDSAEFSFRVALGFNPSSTNFVRVYLASDNANLRSPLNGYYLQLGETGSNDTIKIFRQSGTTTTPVFTASSEIIPSSAATVNINFYITRKTGGKWDVFADKNGGSNFSYYGSFTDNTFSSTSHFGFFCRYSTASRFDKYFFDDILIRNIVGDTVRPYALIVNIISANQLEVIFSETVDAASAQNVANYQISGGVGNPTSAVVDAVNKSLVRLSLANPLVSGNNYALSLTNVRDLAGNIMQPQTLSFTYYIPKKNDIVINEIMADPEPRVALPAVEYVELHNRTPFPINVDGWKFSDASGIITLPSAVIPQDSSAIIVRKDSAALFSASGVITIPVNSLPSLNNDKDSLSLFDAANNLINAVVYSDAWYADPVKKNGGYSLERINPQNPCLPDNQNWIASTDISGGTPGRRNSVWDNQYGGAFALVSAQLILANQIQLTFSQAADSAALLNPSHYAINNGLTVTGVSAQPPYTSATLTFSGAIDSNLNYTVTVQNVTSCAGATISPAKNKADVIILRPAKPYDVVINEIMPDPEPSVGLPNVEYVELYNRTNFPINLNGWRFSDRSSTAVLPNVFIPAKGFAVIVRKDSAAFFKSLGAVVAEVNTLPSLNNTSDSISLRDPTGQIIHSLVYYDAWYGDDTKKQGGYSLELRNPNNPCAAEGNWLGSTDETGGTPGKSNSVFDPNLSLEFRVGNAFFISTVSIRVFFNQAADVVSASNPQHYVLDAGYGNPQTVVFDSVAGNNVLLLYNQPFDTTRIYQLTVSSVKNCVSSGINATTLLLAFPRVADRYDIIITEIMADPDPPVQLPNREYLELYNRSNKAISLKNWILGKPTTKTDAKLPDILMMPGAYLLVCAATAVGEFSPFTFPAGVSSFPSLTNTGDAIYLKDERGNLIHYVEYNDSWYRDNNKKSGGYSLEMIDVNFPCGGAFNWTASNSATGGTPGAPNAVSANNPDTTLPNIIRAALINSNTLSITFSETLDSASAANVNHYTVNNNVGNPSAAVALPFAFSRVLLTFNQPFQPGIIYSVKVKGVSDCSGNGIGINDTARFAVPDTLKTGELVINEILFNPRTGGVDYVEIYNPTQKKFDISRLVVEERDVADPFKSLGISDTLQEPFLLFPDEYLVYTSEPNVVQQQYFVKNPSQVIGVKRFPNFPDKEGIVILKTYSGIIIDSLAYSSKWHYKLLDDKNGVSLERIDYLKPTNDKNNWHSAASDIGFGTPTYLNSQFYATGISDDALSVEPEVFSPDNDGFKDFTLIKYKFTEPGYQISIRIFDAVGRQVKYLVKAETLGAEGVFQWDGTDDEGRKARTGIYTIFAEVFNLEGKTKRFKKNVVVGARLD
ncbi:MAG: lamin tail domain-containing protein, partial [Chitinophagales bacterium]|nr:lamin tail domain-containing protein [Chitinophagales bacterium]MDW8274031.1 lamin tail domain-containing protein [Chitinophagales bacterium]